MTSGEPGVRLVGVAPTDEVRAAAVARLGLVLRHAGATRFRIDIRESERLEVLVELPESPAYDLAAAVEREAHRVLDQGHHGRIVVRFGPLPPPPPRRAAVAAPRRGTPSLRRA